MKYANSLVFLGLMVMVAGCQKKEKVEQKKAAHHTLAKVAKEPKGGKKGPTKLETKKSVAHKAAEHKNVHQAASMKKENHAPKKDAHKKAAESKSKKKAQ